MPDPYRLTTAAIAITSTETSATVTSTLVAAVAGKKIRVKGLWINIHDAAITNLRFMTGSTALTGQADFADDDDLVLPVVSADGESRWFETTAGVALTMEHTNGGTAADISGVVVYTEAH